MTERQSKYQRKSKWRH